MSTDDTRSFELPELVTWLSRLAGDTHVLARFRSNPMIFSTWYTLFGDIVPWPKPVKSLVDQHRAAKLSFEEASDLLRKVNYATGDFGDSEQAARILEGYIVHAWVVENTDEFSLLMAAVCATFGKELIDTTPANKDMASRIHEMATALGLASTEKKVLKLALVCEVSRTLRSLLEQLVKSKRGDSSSLWAGMLGCTVQELRDALSSKGVLRKSRLLRAKGSTTKLPTLSPFWVDALTDTLTDFFDTLLKPLSPKVGAGIPARMTPEDFELAAQVLANGTTQGVNLLFYGAEGLEKRALLGQLLDKVEKPGFVLEEHEQVYHDWPTIAFVAQRLLFQRFGHKAVLVIEKPSEVLERRPSEFLRTLFGIEVDSSHISPFDELALESNPTATIWAGPGTEQLSEECVARFVFHAPLKKARREERRAQLAQFVEQMRLNKGTQAELLALEDVSARQLETGVRAAALSGATTKKAREAALVQAVKRSLQALHRQATPRVKECVTQYSLKYLNYSGKFGPEQLLKAFDKRPKGSLCLYGPPGTGKTQFVEYLAEKLGKRLMVKRASDLLSKWVGDSEKNISAMFQEAENEEVILFLDEGDSFLRDRSLAQAGWEVTKVNELLQHMERFNGIFIVATNLFKGLDTAALRRFTFKMELRTLNFDQRWEMFVTETGIKGQVVAKDLRELWRTALMAMPQLAAGDFATVKRQCILLDEKLTPPQWIEQLQLECKVKGAPAE